MKQICIFDILGSYCGMHYYDIAFAEAFRERGYKTMIYSNFKEKKEDCCFFSSFFTCCKFIGCFRILYAYLKFLFFVFFHYNYKIIYLAYGELYEVPFLIIASCGKHVFVDVHEVYALKYKDTSFTSKLFKWLYRSRIHNVIYHSQRTYDLLNNDRLKMLYVPHFRYVFQKSCQIENVSQEILDCFKCSSPRYLFFGNLTTVKGVDVVCEAFEHLKKLNVNYELVIAGKNVDSYDFSKQRNSKTKIFDRHINDDELIYLYSNSDYILLPYRKSSQSGIFAMAAYFHKPMILSDIPYFLSMIEKYPSFGIISSLKNISDTLKTTMESHGNYYTNVDCEKFEKKKDIDNFVSLFIKV